MSNPPDCPHCHAPIPDSLESLGPGFACQACGRVLRAPESPAKKTPLEIARQRDLDDDDDDEDGDEDVNGTPTLPPLNDLLSDAWEIFSAKMGLCVGVGALVMLMNLVAQAPELYWNLYLKMRFADPTQREFISLGMSLYSWLRFAFTLMVGIGNIQFLLHVIRGESAGAGDLFQGGPYFWRTVLCTLMFGLAVFAGTLLCIVPGVIVALMFGQFQFLIVDRNLRGLDPLRKSMEMTDGYKWDLLAIFIVCTLINVCGLLALGIGILFTTPFTMIVTALVYERLSGRPRRSLEIEASAWEE